MPGFRPEDLPLTQARGGFRQHAVQAGGLTVAYEVVPAGDYGAGDACPTPHWGYVLEGRAQVRYDGQDGVETLEAGQAYYLPPGHRIVVETDSRVVELSPAPAPVLGPLPAVLGFLDAVNRNDLPRIAGLLAAGHALSLFGGAPIAGAAAALAVWTDYLGRFPAFTFHPAQFVEAGPRVVVLGSTTGSHMGLPDAAERQGRQLWVADVAGGRLASWTMLEDTPASRAALAGGA